MCNGLLSAHLAKLVEIWRRFLLEGWLLFTSQKEANPLCFMVRGQNEAADLSEESITTRYLIDAEICSWLDLGKGVGQG